MTLLGLFPSSTLVRRECWEAICVSLKMPKTSWNWRSTQLRNFTMSPRPWASPASLKLRWPLVCVKHSSAGNVVSGQWTVQMPGRYFLRDHTSSTCWIMSFPWTTMGCFYRPREGCVGADTWHKLELPNLRLRGGKEKLETESLKLYFSWELLLWDCCVPGSERVT